MQRATEQEYRDALERTISEADQLLGTFNALLSIARAEAGTLRESMTSLDISDVVADAVDLYEPLAEESGQTISVSLDPGLRLFGNRELLSQAIVNLLDNAIKHGTPHDQQSQRIDIEAHRAGGSLIVSVSDHGVGIPEADRERVEEMVQVGLPRKGIYRDHASTVLQDPGLNPRRPAVAWA